MKVNMLSLCIRGALGALWGLSAVIGAYMLGAWLPEFEFIFYPLIFAGAAPMAALFTGSSISLRRAVFVGLVSGIIYGLISPLFPLLAAILSGASIGGGLARNSDEPGALLNLILNTLKGAVVLPILILVGSAISGSIYMVSQAPLYQWLFWGFWSTVGIMIIRSGSKEDTDHNYSARQKSGHDEFRSEAKKIMREIEELSFKLDR